MGSRDHSAFRSRENLNNMVPGWQNASIESLGAREGEWPGSRGSCVERALGWVAPENFPSLAPGDPVEVVIRAAMVGWIHA